MITIRLAATCCTLMTLVLLNACTADASKDDDGLSVTEQTSNTTTTPMDEPTHAYTPLPGDSPNSMTPRRSSTPLTPTW